jgi:hypothetical protein
MAVVLGLTHRSPVGSQTASLVREAWPLHHRVNLGATSKYRRCPHFRLSRRQIDRLRARQAAGFPREYELGCFTGIIRYQTRLFVPVERAGEVLARLMR